MTSAIFVNKNNPLQFVQGASVIAEELAGWNTSKGYFRRDQWYIATGGVDLDNTRQSTHKILAIVPPVEQLDQLINKFLSDVIQEYLRQRQQHPPLASAHEGYAIVLEEMDEVWEVVKRGGSYKELTTECIQVAASVMAIVVEAKETR